MRNSPSLLYHQHHTMFSRSMIIKIFVLLCAFTASSAFSTPPTTNGISKQTTALSAVQEEAAKAVPISRNGFLKAAFASSVAAVAVFGDASPSSADENCFNSVKECETQKFIEVRTPWWAPWRGRTRRLESEEDKKEYCKNVTTCPTPSGRSNNWNVVGGLLQGIKAKD